MAATYPVFLKHTHIGKATQKQPYTARAHSRYVQRQRATHTVDTYLLPDSYQARQRWFFDHENATRKNGRVIDKFTVTVPYGVTEDHARETLTRFGKWLGQERCPFMFTLQGFDSNNHHAHFIFVDRDVETGKRVYGTTDLNSTRGIKLEWERVANDTFAELGYDIQVKVKDWQAEIANDNDLDEVSDDIPTPTGPESQVELESAPDIATLPDTDPVSGMGTDSPLPSEDTHEGDEDMAVIEREPDTQISSAAAEIRFLHGTVTELNRLRDAKARLQEAEQRYQSLSKQRENAAIEASSYGITSQAIYQNQYAAKRRLEENQTKDGKLKGFGVNILGIPLRTPARARAEDAVKAVENSEFASELARKKQAAYDHSVEVLSAQASAAEREAYMRQNELRELYGTDVEIAEAEGAMDKTVRRVIQGVPMDDAAHALLNDEITTDEFELYVKESGQEAVLGAYKEVQEKIKYRDIEI